MPMQAIETLIGVTIIAQDRDVVIDCKELESSNIYAHFGFYTAHSYSICLSIVCSRNVLTLCC